jgi:hypothetical protein
MSSKLNAIKITLAVAIASSACLSTVSALAGENSDAFNRPSLGSNWVVTSGSLSITDDQLVGLSAESLGYLTPVSKNQTAASAVVFLGGTDLEYGAVAVGDINAGTNAFVKIQSDNGVGTFDHAAFYTGNNGGSGCSGCDDFFELSSPVPSPAILDVWFCGDRAVMQITSSAGVQTYTYNYHTKFVGGAGLGTYGSVSLDNFVEFAKACTDVPANAIPALQMRSAQDATR